MSRKIILALAAVVCFATVALADPVYYANEADFSAAASGYVLTDYEDFEEAAASSTFEFCPFDSDPGNDVTPSTAFPDGINATNLAVQIAYPDGTWDEWVMAYVYGPDYLQPGRPPSFVPVPIDNRENCNLLFDEPGLDAVSFDVGILQGDGTDGTVDITLYGADQTTVIGAVQWTATLDGSFFGVVADQPIGRIHLAAWLFGGETQEWADNIAMYNVPEPGTLALLGLAALTLLRRSARR